MANSQYAYVEVRFDLREKELTHVYVLLKSSGDSPIGVDGWHYKAFPASKCALEIMELMGSEDDPVMWPQKAPE